MARRRSVIHVSSGKIFSTCADAERALDLPSGVLSECIRLGKPCHGHVFQFVDEEDDLDSTPIQTNDSLDAKATKYEGSSTDKEAALKYFEDLGYDVVIENNVILFYGVHFEDVRSVVEDSGYISSWGTRLKHDKPDEEQ